MAGMGSIPEDGLTQPLLGGEGGTREPEWMRKKPKLTVMSEQVATDTSSEVTEVHMCLKVLKLTFSIFVGLLLLACLVSSKVSLIIIAQSLAEARNENYVNAKTQPPSENRIARAAVNVTTATPGTETILNITQSFANATRNLTTPDVTDATTILTTPDVTTIVEGTATEGPIPTPAAENYFSVSVESALIILTIVIMMPYLLTFLRCVWRGRWGKNTPWPTREALLIGLLTAVLEVVGLTMFTVVVMSTARRSLSIVLMNSIFLIPAMVQIIRHFRGMQGCGKTLLEGCKNAGNLLGNVLACLLAVASLLAVVGMEDTVNTQVSGDLRKEDLAAIVISLLCLSVTWLPTFQEVQTFHSLDDDEEDSGSDVTPPEAQDEEDVVLDMPTTHRNLRMSRISTTMRRLSTLQPPVRARPRVPEEVPKETPQEVTKVDALPMESARWRCGMITNFLKLLLTFPMVLLWYEVFFPGESASEFFNGGVYNVFNGITTDNTVLIAFIVNLTAGFGANLVAWMACSIRMDVIGFVLPLLLDPLVMALYTYIDVLCVFPVVGWNKATYLANIATFWNETSLTMMCGDHHAGAHDIQWVWGVDVVIMIALYVAMVITSARYLFRSSATIMEKEEKLFWLPGYNTIFPDQWLMLSRRNKDTSPELFERTTRSMKNTRVYICTTMYRENEQEMQQLLQSIRGIAEAQGPERQYECHVFFDGGCQKGQPTEFALQLLSLTDKTMGSKKVKKGVLQQAQKWVTPYGLQVEWRLKLAADSHRETRFCIHLKDNSKVRNKKRWSQVMYMSYVLDHLVYYSPLGMESGAVKDKDIVASSEDSDHTAKGARLNSASCWRTEATASYAPQYLQVDLGEEMMVTGVVTQGNPDAQEWVQKYKLGYRKDEDSCYEYYKNSDGRDMIFEGNKDNKTPVTQLLQKPVLARYIRIEADAVHGQLALRAEILGYDSEERDRDSYILCTDADVKFSPESANALLDVIMRDPSVGAVCGRTHPVGSGPMVWYQIFDYAIGHWFQKTANDTLGTVLCCPGCFSVYRAKAVREAVKTYASKVDKADEFLTKDMGEDRWFCTLLVERGWLLRYTAVAEDSTYCPEEFDEFFKQRRRWTPSTIANLMLLIRIWGEGRLKNQNASFLFIFYQACLLFSTLIGPATCILIVQGGLEYVIGYKTNIPLFLQIAACLLYAWCCLNTSQSFQLLLAKGLTLIYALVMTVVAIGTAKQIVLAFVSTSSAGGLIQHMDVCPTEPFKVLQCPGNQVLDITEATYGRRDRGACGPVPVSWNQNYCPEYYEDAYNRNQTLDVVRNGEFDCQSKGLCNLVSSEEYFRASVPVLKWWENRLKELNYTHPEPTYPPAPDCSSVYLEVSYRCSNETHPGWRQTKIACSDEGNTILECDEFSKLDITKATYGRRDPNQCSDVSTVWDPNYCPEYFDYAFNQSRTLEVVTGEDGFGCQGERRCNLIPSQEYFPAEDTVLNWWNNKIRAERTKNPPPKPTNPPPPDCSSVYLAVSYRCRRPSGFDFTLDIPANITVLYFLCLIGIFIVTALVHPTEFYCVLHGIWYLFCLPGGYLILMIYSICNLTDRSWGTREQKTQKADGGSGGENWFDKWMKKIGKMCTSCCPWCRPPGGYQPVPTSERVSVVSEAPTEEEEAVETEDEGPEDAEDESKTGEVGAKARGDADETKEKEALIDKSQRSVGFAVGPDESEDEPRPVLRKKTPWVHPKSFRGPSARRVDRQQSQRRQAEQPRLDRRLTRKFSEYYRREDVVVSVRSWLKKYFEDWKNRETYENCFADHGYDDTSFIAGMKEGDLKEIGIASDFHRTKLMGEIKKLPEYIADYKVPENTREWLKSVGLYQYTQNFLDQDVVTKWDLAIVKSIDVSELKEKYGITKKAHVKRIMNSLKNMRNPNDREADIERVRFIVDKLKTTTMLEEKSSRLNEALFWEALRAQCLNPELNTFNEVEELKNALVDLRNGWLMVFAVANAIWLTLILVLTSQSELAVLGSNPIGLATALCFGVIQAVQFLAMLFHRGITLLHHIARVPYPTRRPTFTNQQKKKTGETAGVQAMPSRGDVQFQNGHVNGAFMMEEMGAGPRV